MKKIENTNELNLIYSNLSSINCTMNSDIHTHHLSYLAVNAFGFANDCAVTSIFFLGDLPFLPFEYFEYDAETLDGR